MTAEEKQILLNDLKSRLYTKTKCQCIWAVVAKNCSAGVINELDTYIIDELEMIDYPDCDHLFSDIKPYLRPMSSMTEEERKELFEIEDNMQFHSNSVYSPDRFDFYTRKHFDYRGLIPMGLALEAPKDMYNLINK